MAAFDMWNAPRHSVEETADWQTINRIKEALEWGKHVRVFHNTELVYVANEDQVCLYDALNFEEINNIWLKNVPYSMDEAIEKINHLIREDELDGDALGIASTARFDIEWTDD
jgi:hypothetical protein